MTLAQFDRCPDRDLWIARYERDRDKCPQCHGDRATCSDPEQPWYPQRGVCYATMAQKSLEARYDQKYDAMPYHDGTFQNFAAKRSAMFPFHVSEGVSLWVAADDLDPDGDWL